MTTRRAECSCGQLAAICEGEHRCSDANGASERRLAAEKCCADLDVIPQPVEDFVPHQRRGDKSSHTDPRTKKRNASHPSVSPVRTKRTVTDLLVDS